jgi:hypothetical protein
LPRAQHKTSQKTNANHSTGRSHVDFDGKFSDADFAGNRSCWALPLLRCSSSISFLTRFYRIVSFFALGIVLLVVSFFYQRLSAAGAEDKSA